MALEKLVKDVMRPLSRYPWIDENEKVERALGLMAGAGGECERAHLIVVGEGDSENKVIKGSVTPPEIVFGMADHFLKGAASTGPIFWEGQLQSECMEAFQKRVGDIMTPVTTCINGSEKLMEAIFLLNRHRVGFLPVVRCEEVVGIVHLEDILKEIVKMNADEETGRLADGQGGRSGN